MGYAIYRYPEAGCEDDGMLDVLAAQEVLSS
jgi:hypothetical protein